TVAGSMYALTFSLYALRYFETLGWMEPLFVVFGVGDDPVSREEFTLGAIKVVAVVTAVLFIYINYRGASETGKIGAVITMGQTIFVIGIGIVGLVVVKNDPSRLENFRPFMPAGWGKLLITMGFTYVAFEGFEVIAQSGDEAIEPRRNL